MLRAASMPPSGSALPAGRALVRHPVSFTGAAGEYRGVWASCTLLMLCTLGLYYPWAVKRRLRYFYQRTHVAGQTLDYEIVPRQLFWNNVTGYLVINGLFFGASKAGALAPYLVSGLQLGLTLLVPLMLAGYAQFDITHTSWRGRRLGLAAKPAAAFRAMGLPTLIYLAGAAALVWALNTWKGGDAARARWLALAATPLLSFGVALIYAHYRAFLHTHISLGTHGVPSQRPAGIGGLYGLALRTAALASVAFAVLVLPAAWWLAGKLGITAQQINLGPAAGAAPGWSALQFSLAMTALLVIATVALPYPYLAGHLQNRMWSATGAPGWQFESRLNVPAYVRMVCKNTVLTLLTLGWYFPVGVIAAARMRAEAIALYAQPELLAGLDAGEAGPAATAGPAHRSTRGQAAAA